MIERTRTRPLLFVALLHVTVAVSGCEQTTVTAVEVSAIQISPDRITIGLGDRGALSAIGKESGGAVLPAGAAEWSSDDPAIVLVHGNGTVEGLAVGTTRVHATVGGMRGTALVTVVAPEDGPGPSGGGYVDSRWPVTVPPGATVTNLKARSDRLEYRLVTDLGFGAVFDRLHPELVGDGWNLRSLDRKSDKVEAEYRRGRHELEVTVEADKGRVKVDLEIDD